MKSSNGKTERGATTGRKRKPWTRKRENPKGKKRKEVREKERTGERGHAKRE